jgi:hypothetical protein
VEDEDNVDLLRRQSKNHRQKQLSIRHEIAYPS